jgi:hypothetical protein
MLDIFKDNAFGVLSLTDAINALKFQPGLINSKNLFTETAITTTTVAVEQRDGILSLIGPTPRGGPGHTLDKGPRVMRALAVPHFEINDAVMAEEVQGVRAWGQETEIETVAGRLNERFVLHTASMEATHEYSRIGAIKGIVTYADGQTLNLFTEFGVTQDTEIDFDLDNASPTSGVLRTKTASVIRIMSTNLDGVPFSGVGALVGDAFFDNLLAHSEVRETFKNQPEAARLRDSYISNGLSYGAFEFGGILWENYRGAVGGTAFIDTNKAHFYPIGVPGLFRTYYAPADYIETVNRPGRRLVTRQYEMQNGKGIHLDTQMNALDICTRPTALLKGKRT